MTLPQYLLSLLRAHASNPRRPTATLDELARSARWRGYVRCETKAQDWATVEAALIGLALDGLAEPDGTGESVWRAVVKVEVPK